MWVLAELMVRESSVAVRQVCEIYLADGKYVFWAFIDLSKSDDMIDRHAWYVADAKSVWSCRKLLKALQSFYIESSSCVRIGIDVSEWFLLSVGLKHDCVDGVVLGANAMVLGQGLELMRANCGIFERNQLLFVLEVV